MQGKAIYNKYLTVETYKLLSLSKCILPNTVIVWCYISVEVYFIGIQSSLLDLCLEAMDIYKFLDQLNDSTKMHFSQYIVNEMLPHMLK